MPNQILTSQDWPKVIKTMLYDVAILRFFSCSIEYSTLYEIVISIVHFSSFAHEIYVIQWNFKLRTMLDPLKSLKIRN
jgi:hypothetical protein